MTFLRSAAAILALVSGGEPCGWLSVAVAAGSSSIMTGRTLQPAAAEWWSTTAAAAPVPPCPMYY
jgi:hypothetical protein